MIANPTQTQICKRVLISGSVQNILFRYFTCKRALTLQLTGSIRYLSDGRVETIIQGERPLVDIMMNWLLKGPPRSQVESIEAQEQALQPFNSFEVRY